jgi:hypothetical protein
MDLLMSAAKLHCLRQKFKDLAQRTQTPLQDEEQLRCTCAHPERGEAEEGRDTVVAEIQKAKSLGVPWRAYRLYLYRGKATLTAIYLRVRVAGRATVGSIISIS